MLAVWTKQSALPALGACALWLLWRDPRRGLRWTLAAAVVLGGSLALADLALHGGLLTHLFLPNAEALTLDRLGKNAAALWDEHWPLILVAAAAAGALALAAWRVRRPPALSLLFAALSLPAALWTNLSPLANYNHLLPLLLPLCLLVGVGLGHALAYARERGRVAWAWPVAVVVVLLGQATLFTPLHRWYSPLGQPLAEKADRLARMLPEVAAAPGRTALSRGRLARARRRARRCPSTTRRCWRPRRRAAAGIRLSSCRTSRGASSPW